MSRKRRADAESTSLSFLDVVVCGFGAVILLLVLTKIFEPVICQPSSLSTAVQVAAPASLPLPGSVSDRQPISSPLAILGR